MRHAILDAAIELLSLGYAPIPIRTGSKAPAVKWKRYQHCLPTAFQVERWFDDLTRNLAISIRGLAVLDCDAADRADFVQSRCGRTPVRCRTPRGLHLYYRKPPGSVSGNRVRIHGLSVDLRTDGGLVLVPPSRTPLGEYRWIGLGLFPIDELPEANLDWLQPPIRIGQLAVTTTDNQRIRRARRYLASVEGATAGYGGHNVTMRAASLLVQKFSLDIDEAFPLLAEWNETCEPPWSEKELLHKLQDAKRLRSNQGAC